MYNRNMTKQQPRKRSSMIFLILGLAFLAIGLATDQTAFTWIAIAFVLISLVTGGRWLRRRK
jgi:membrane protein implicated in regulation of membrane protease activity